MSRLDRTKLTMFPVAQRDSKLKIEEIAVSPESPASLSDAERELVGRVTTGIRNARATGSPVMLTYGAHLIKNGLGPVVIRLLEEGWLTHVATNGAGSIHDWEFAYSGVSTEDVRANTAIGRFGTWDETGRYIGLALAIGAAQGLGYGWSVGQMIEHEGLEIPDVAEMREAIADTVRIIGIDDSLCASADLAALLSRSGPRAGFLPIPHSFKRFSVQWACYTRGIPFTVHPGIGYDIIYTHPMLDGGIVGRASVRDFLEYAYTVSRLRGGVHLTVGSSVMAPMIFEKAFSMANNAALTRGEPPITDHYMAVVDIQDGGGWDWRAGEPPMDNPAYYLRFCKSFYRMGGTLDYLCMDNRRFLLGLHRALNEHKDAN